MSKEKYLEVAEKVIQWAHDRNLIKGSTPAHQFLKLTEELKEVTDAETETDLINEIGDFHVVSIIMLEQLGKSKLLCEKVSFSSCAWIDIMGDLAGAISKGKLPEFRIIPAMNRINDYLPEGKTPNDALLAAYNKIKDRKGRMIDGVFVKEADL